MVSVNQRYVCVICKNEDEDGLTLRTSWEISFFSRILLNPENAWVCSDCYSRETSNREEIEKASKLQNLLISEFANEFLLREQKKNQMTFLENKVDDLSKKALDAEIGIANLQSETRELKNSDIEQNKKILATQNQTDQNTQEIKENKQQTRQLETKITNLEENQQTLWKKVFPAKETSHNIYDFDTYYHWIGWYVFLVLAGYIARKVYRIKTKKRQESKNYLVEIRKIFQEWQLNMYASTGAYVAGFFLIQQAIAKWINPRISGWLLTQKAITIIAVSLLVGIGFYLDGIITSSLKTPLQRLGIRIENANIEEKTKKSLLSKTQQVSELFKETLKRFGLLAVVGILTKLIEAFWNKDILSYLSYAVPILGAIKIIWEVDKSLKKLQLGGSKKN